MKSDTIPYSEYQRIYGPPTVTIEQTTWERALRIERLAREALAAYDKSDSDGNPWIAAQAALRKALL
jgi:hypothetical protein